MLSENFKRYNAKLDSAHANAYEKLDKVVRTATHEIGHRMNIVMNEKDASQK
jgi:predicted Zn-dependent protease